LCWSSIRLVGDDWVGCSQHHKAQDGALGGLVGANAISETLAGTLQATGTIKMPCSGLLASHQRKCEYRWPAWQNADVRHLKTGDEITTHG
jgi:hypothetical protein